LPIFIFLKGSETYLNIFNSPTPTYRIVIILRLSSSVSASFYLSQTTDPIGNKFG